MRLTYDRVLVTGGTGFIGSHTVDALLHQGAQVWVLDDLSSGSLRNLKQWKKSRNLHIEKGSIANYKTVDHLARKADTILHLAAVVSPEVSFRTPEVANEVNVSGTLNVLRAGLKNQVRNVVFASSSSVYGNPSSIPTKESAPLAPTTPYGVSKLAAERYCHVFSKTYGLSTVSLRYFNVYGERQTANPYSGVIAIFSDCFIRNARPKIFGTGNQERDFIHVSDVVHANLLAMKTTNAKGEAFNIGTGRATTVNSLALMLAELLGKKTVKPIYTNPRRGDVARSCADTANSKKILGFEPRVPLRDGLKQLMESLRFNTS